MVRLRDSVSRIVAPIGYECARRIRPVLRLRRVRFSTLADYYMESVPNVVAVLNHCAAKENWVSTMSRKLVTLALFLLVPMN